MREQGLSHKVYSLLLQLYPQEFRERFGPEMEQNFTDLSRESTVLGRFRWLRVVWFFSDVIVQAGRENFEFFRRRKFMNSIVSSRRVAAYVGVATILPGTVLMLLLFLGIEPPLGPLRDILATPPDGSSVLGIGSFVALGIIVVLPVIGVVITGAALTGKKIFSDIGISFVIGLLVVLPLAMLQLTLGRSSYSSFPLPLFGLLWLLPALFSTVAAPAVRTIREGGTIFAHPAILITRIMFLVLIGAFWVGMTADQLPCFLGVPNCD